MMPVASPCTRPNKYFVFTGDVVPAHRNMPKKEALANSQIKSDKHRVDNLLSLLLLFKMYFAKFGVVATKTFR